MCPAIPSPGFPTPNTSSGSQHEWLCVFEVDKPAADRRHATLEHVHVAKTLTPPGPELDDRVRTDRKWRKRRFRKVLYELMPRDDEKGGRRMPFIMPGEKRAATKATKALRDRLSGLGYTVNGDSTVWRLYVIELVQERVPTSQSSRGYVYVGQTSLPVAERAKQHRLGPAYADRYTKFSRVCHRYFKQLRLDLLPRWACKTFFSRCAALQAEGRLRLHFERAGYKVEGGTELLGKKRHECGPLRP